MRPQLSPTDWKISEQTNPTKLTSASEEMEMERRARSPAVYSAAAAPSSRPGPPASPPLSVDSVSLAPRLGRRLRMLCGQRHAARDSQSGSHKWAAVCRLSSLPACRLRASRLRLETGTDSGRRCTQLNRNTWMQQG